MGEEEGGKEKLHETVRGRRGGGKIEGGERDTRDGRTNKKETETERINDTKV